MSINVRVYFNYLYVLICRQGVYLRHNLRYTQFPSSACFDSFITVLSDTNSCTFRTSYQFEEIILYQCHMLPTHFILLKIGKSNDSFFNNTTYLYSLRFTYRSQHNPVVRKIGSYLDLVLKEILFSFFDNLPLTKSTVKIIHPQPHSSRVLFLNRYPSYF